MKLYEITNEYQQALSFLQGMDDLTPEDIDNSISAIQADFNDKAIALSSFTKNIEADILAMKEAEASIANRRNVLQKRIESVKLYLLDNMERVGISNIHSPYFDIKLKKCPPSIVITNEELLPDSVMRIKTIKEPDKKLIKELITDSTLVSGAKLEANKFRVEIK